MLSSGLGVDFCYSGLWPIPRGDGTSIALSNKVSRSSVTL